MLKRSTWWVASAFSFIAATSVHALGINTGTGGLEASQQAQPMPEVQVQDAGKSNYQTGTYYGPANGPAGMNGQSAMMGVPPYGSQLFQGGFRGTRSDGLNPDYVVAPGDLITLRLWGAVEIERVLPVDAKGYVFIPTVGPVKVQGTSLQGLNSRVKAAVQTVYPENVNVYTNLQGTQPVAIFVTGEVKNPGRYAGTPNDSVLYFLDQAGGIDEQLGSFRQIRVLRSGKTIASIDLYRFLKEGVLPKVQFRDGDTVVVEERQAAVMVSGDVERDYLFELNNQESAGRNLIRFAPTKPGITHVLVRGVRDSGLFSKYFTLDEFATAILSDGDEVLFSADQKPDTIVVQLEGSFNGPARYAVPRDTTLISLLDNVSVPQNLTDTRNISLRRVSVAERQRQSLMDSLRRLETTYLGASSSTPEEAEIRVREAELIAKFIEKASKAEPTGRMVVANRGNVADIRLQDGDVITIPETTQSVLISGEVLIPQALVYESGESVVDYIERSGGFTQHADEENILLVRLNGEVLNADRAKLQPGDEIIVLPEVPTKNLQLATSITQILYQLAVATKVALDL
jgi:protein involved in polysaccharide export with SLBB domain